MDSPSVVEFDYRTVDVEGVLAGTVANGQGCRLTVTVFDWHRLESCSGEAGAYRDLLQTTSAFYDWLLVFPP
jgi:hypothetical protein